MKRILASSLTLAALTFPGLCLAEHGVTAVNAFVREAPSIDSRAIGAIQKGVALSYTVAPSNSNWLKVQFSGGEGYMGRKTITPSATAKVLPRKEKEASVGDNVVSKPQPVATRSITGSF